MRRFYAYDRTPLDAKVESVDDTNPSWRLEKITFKTAYDANRMAAYLFLPAASNRRIRRWSIFRGRPRYVSGRSKPA